MDKIDISIIIPCYNQGTYLEEALSSVSVQTYSNWECIIINDGSTDQSEEIALAWCNKDKRFRYLFIPNSGLSSARNTGIATAIGEFILPLDADDLIHKDYLRLARLSFHNNKRLSLVYCNAQRFGIENGPWVLEDYDYIRLLISNSIFCSAMFRKLDWSRIDGYDESFKSGFEDWDFWIRLLNKESLVYKIPETLFFYRIKEFSMYKDMDRIHIENAQWKIFQKNQEIYQEHFHSPLTLIQESIHLKNETNRLKAHLQTILSSNSYKVGKIILQPAAFIKRLLKA